MLPAAGLDTTNEIMTIDGQSRGRIFEGLGALSAGASSRLLIDYPEPQRSQVLDFLFKPRYGASLHHLKCEIGGDTQSTDGTEPSHGRTRNELLHPEPGYYQRGYEWWLLREARLRNRDIYLDVLQWGAPGWIGNEREGKLRAFGLNSGQIDGLKFFSGENAAFIATFIQGAKKYHGVDIDYCGVRNERGHDVTWIKLLRNTLDRHELRRVKIVAADACCGSQWDIVEDVREDAELRRAVEVIGVHYPEFKSPDEAKRLNLPLWSSEDGFWDQTQDPWQAARIVAKMYNRNYVQGRMTKTIIWSLIDSYYDNLPFPNSGLMKANQPWSGHYEVLPAIWATAHTTQFAQPGWQYLDSACALVPSGGSQVALRNGRGDFSLIVETIDAKAPRTLTFRLAGGLKANELHVWRTTEREPFVQLADLRVERDAFSVVLEPEAIYSFTTTTGQSKGGVMQIPASGDFPMPYREDFEAYDPGGAPKYFMDQCGVFEVAKRSDGQGQCLRQVITIRPIEWSPMRWPVTLVGADAWANYEATCSVRAGNGRLARLLARANRHDLNQGSGYALSIYSDGAWGLSVVSTDRILASGQTALKPDTWHTLRLRCWGPQITAFVNGVQVAQVLSLDCRYGMAGVGAGGWYEADFDNLRVEPIAEPPLRVENLAAGAKATASSVLGPEFDARFANDQRPNSRWNAASGHLTDEWLELDFGHPVRLDTVKVHQHFARITRYKLQAFDGAEWREVMRRERGGQTEWLDTFPAIEASKLRLWVVAVAGRHPQYHAPAICEIEAYDTSAISGQR